MNIQVTPCHDPMRRLFHERVGQYFEIPGEPGLYKGSCAVCGGEITSVIPDSSKKLPQCLEQRTITQKRPRPKPGFPVEYGSPAETKEVPVDKNKKNGPMMQVVGANCAIAGVGAITLISPDAVYLAANALPTKPLPSDMTAEPVEPGILVRFWRKFLANPPKTPFLLIVWGQKANSPLVMTENLSRTAICGGATPVYVDVPRLTGFVPLVTRMGVEDFRALCLARFQISAIGSGSKAKEAADLAYELRDKYALTTDEFRSLPDYDSIEMDMIGKLFGEGNAQFKGKDKVKDAA